MSFDQDPGEQANISGADLAILVDELKTLRIALRVAIDALLTCDAGDTSTGHVIHPSFSETAVEDAIVIGLEALPNHAESSEPANTRRN